MLHALPFWYLFRELCSGLRQEEEGGACVNERVLSRSVDCPNMIGLLLSKPDVKANVHSFTVVSNGLEELDSLPSMLWGVVCRCTHEVGSGMSSVT